MRPPLRTWSKCNTLEDRWTHAHAGWLVCAHSTSFRVMVVATVLGFTTAVVRGCGGLPLLCMATAFVIAFTVEMLNTAIELAVDRISVEWHHISKDAKDVAACASAVASTFAFAVNILGCILVWK